MQRLVFALVNEGAKIWKGHCQQVRRHRHGVPDGLRLPIHRGGPMHYASEVGLFNVVQSQNRFAQNPMDDASAWAPAPLPGQAGR